MAAKSIEKEAPPKFVIDETRPHNKYLIGTETKGKQRITNEVIDYLDERGTVHILVTHVTLDNNGGIVSEKQKVITHKGKIKTRLVNNRPTFYVTGGGPTPWHLQH